MDGDVAAHLCSGTLVLWVPKSSPLDPQKLKMDLLTRAEVQRIAIANPQHAPYGRAAMAALEHFGLKDKVASKLVYGREHQPGGAVCAVGQCAGGADRAVAGDVSGDEGCGELLGVAGGGVSADAAGSGAGGGVEAQGRGAGVLEYVVSPEGAAVLQQYGFGAAQP